jgi:cell division septation protein DedD
MVRMMVTIRTRKVAIGVGLLLLAAGCSREQQDWRSAESADTIESYGQFVQRHPESELATQARTRVTQLGEDRDWQHAGSADTADAYRQFIAQHPNGKWAQEARIRIENFSLGAQPPPGDARGAAGIVFQPRQETAAPVPPTRDTPFSAPQQPRRDTAPPPPVQQAARPAPTSIPTSVYNTGAPSGFAIQLGAFSTQAGADNEWRSLGGRFAAELQGLAERVVAADTPSGRLYRLQAAVSDEAHARAVCDILKKHSQGCVPVLPH